MGSFATKIMVFLSVIAFGFGSVFAQTTYYSQGNGNFSNASNWDTNRSGGGSNPTSFDQGDIFTIQNGHTITMDNVSNLVQDLIIENGGAFDNASYTITFAVGSHGLDVQSGGTYTANTGTIECNAGALNTVILKINANTTFYNILTSSPLTLDANSTGSTFTVNGTLKFSTTRAFTLQNGAAIAYGTNGTLDYNAGRTVSGEWPTTGGVPYVKLSSGTTTISDGNTHQVNSKLTLTDGSISVSSGALAYGTGVTLEYLGTSQQIVGDEWTTSLAPASVIVNNSSGSSPAVDLGSTDLAALTGTLELQNGSLDYSAGSHNLTVTNGTVKGTSSGYYGTVNSNKLTLDQGGTITSTGTPHFYDIDLTTSGTFTLQNNFEVQGTLTVGAGTATVNSAFTLAANGSINVSGGTLDLNGVNITEGASSGLTVGASGTLKTGGADITNYNSYSLAGTVEFDGSSAETIPAASSIGTLVVNNASGVQTSSAITVNTALTLTDGTVTSSAANTLRLADGITVTQTDKTDFIIGPVEKEFNSSGDTQFTYPIGYTSTYLPATFTYSGLTGTAVIELACVSGDPGGTAPSGISSIATSHYYTLQEITAPTSYTSYDIELTWTGTGFSQDRNQILVQNGAGPTYEYSAASAHTSTTVKRSGLSAYPSDDHRLAFGSSTTTVTWDGGGDGTTWSDASNWTNDEEPQTGDAVDFSGNYGSTQNVTYDAAATATEFASIAVNPAGGTVNLTLTKSATINLTATSNALVVNSGNSLTYNGSTVEMGGSAYDQTLTTYSGSVEYATGSVYVDTYSDLTINGATGTSGSGTTTVSGTLTKDGADFTTSGAFTAAAYTNTAGTATFNGGLTVSGATALNGGSLAGSVTVQGNVSFGGGSAAGTFTFSGTNAQAISGSGAAFNNMTINKSSNDVTCNTAVSVSGVLTLTSGDIITTSTNKLTMGTAASYSGGGNASHVNGPLARMTNSDSKSYEFPIGDGTHQRRVRIAPTSSTAETYTAELKYGGNGGQDVSTNYGTGINHVSSVYYWEITRSGSVNARVDLYWESENDGVADGHESEILTARYDGSQWVDAGGLGNYVGDYTSGRVQSNTVSISTGSNPQFVLATSTSDNSLPVELASFTASADYGKVVLDWTTASELDNLGFNIFRRLLAEEDNWEQINPDMIDGQGNTSQETNYSYIDSKVVAGQTYVYKLQSVSINGVLADEKTIEVSIPVPTEYALFNNYPNPFNPTTSIRFQMPETHNVQLTIYDSQGRIVKQLIKNESMSRGEHVVTWDASDEIGNRVASGMYFYRFVSGKFSKMGKMILLK